MSFKKVTLLFLISFMLQLSLINIFAVQGTAPNLVMCMMVIITFLYEDGYRSIPFGIFFGLLLDICGGSYVGVCPLVMFVVGIFAAACHVWLNVEKISTLVASALISTLIYQALYFAAMKLLKDPIGAGYMVRFLPLYIFYNVGVMVLMFLLMHKRAEQYHNDRYSE